LELPNVNKPCDIPPPTSPSKCPIEISPETLEQTPRLVPTPETSTPVKREAECSPPNLSINPQKSQSDSRRTMLTPLPTIDQKKRRIVKKRTLNNQW
jgi:hypothetical protein